MKNNIKIERVTRDYTQERLAELIGVSRQTINSIEKGKYVSSMSWHSVVTLELV